MVSTMKPVASTVVGVAQLRLLDGLASGACRAQEGRWSIQSGDDWSNKGHWPTSLSTAAWLSPDDRPPVGRVWVPQMPVKSADYQSIVTRNL